ncbi:MAG: MFS transporter [Chloroflexota bacterium]
MANPTSWKFWGSTLHIRFTVVLFVVVSSMDNAALATPVPLYQQIASHLGIAESAIGAITAIVILLIGLASFGAGYLGDLRQRKPVLSISTAIWAGGMIWSSTADTYIVYLVSQLLAAVGFGGVISVGLSLVNDLISPRHRGLALSVWGLSQGLGVGVGILLGGLLGATEWQTPFLVIGLVGVAASALYLLAYEPEVGQREEELAPLLERGERYSHRIKPSDLPAMLAKRSNVWLLLAATVSQIGYGSMVWLPRLFSEKAQSAGLGLEQATVVGSTVAVAFQIGGIFSIVAGHLGDRWNLRDMRGRVFLSGLGTSLSVPFFLGMFILPLTLSNDIGSTQKEVILGLAKALFSEPGVVLVFGFAFVAIALSSIDSPNWFASVAEVNLPEHRGTIFGVAHLGIAVGRSIGAGGTGIVINVIAAHADAPYDHVWALSLAALFFLPAAACYWLSARSITNDRLAVRRILQRRSA